MAKDGGAKHARRRQPVAGPTRVTLPPDPTQRRDKAALKAAKQQQKPSLCYGQVDDLIVVVLKNKYGFM